MVHTRRGKFLVVFQRPTADTKGEKNMSIIDIASGETVLIFHQKTFTKETWPLVQWSDDEAFAARMVSNEVHFYNTAEFAAGIAHRLRCPNVVCPRTAPFTIAPCASLTVCPTVSPSPSVPLCLPRRLSHCVSHRLVQAALALAPCSTGDPKFAVFVPEAKGAPGSVRLHSLSQLAGDQPPPLARRSFFKCSEVRERERERGKLTREVETPLPSNQPRH